ncbi:MAG TPA: type II toxin-antitoxin system HipA family toxin [Kiritimatiellia bacterium]|nr:type II toxin-antitoxin system HipA family toxin [Kiritimatiellia bacterium]HSA17464.1 type II toxin-antitoxin system HipA family toxin [Kiritimatiellia bacterium]
MSALSVYLHGRLVGRLEQDSSGLLQFTYDQTWLAMPDATPLSRALPLQAESFSGKKARPFFAGILPEEGPRKQIAKILGISDTNDYAMLERIGGECAGAVSLLPEGTAPPAPAEFRHRELTKSELQQIIAELPRRPLMAGTDGVRLSLAGAQDKLPILFAGGTISLPLGDTPSTHILKPEPDRFPGLAANELFCMNLARAIGMNVPDTEYHPIGEKPCILVRRYDRHTDQKGRTLRMHQEDFCQALGLPPEQKYQAEGGPLLSDCIALLREWSSAPVLDIPAFVTSLIFNVLIGNADAHGKNYSFLYTGSERRLAPCYDIVSTLAWPELSKNLAMSIGDCKSVNAFAASAWKKMARKSDLGWPMLRERMADTCLRARNELGAIRDQIASHHEETAGQLSRLVGGRLDRMLAALGREEP